MFKNPGTAPQDALVYCATAYLSAVGQEDSPAIHMEVEMCRYESLQEEQTTLFPLFPAPFIQRYQLYPIVPIPQDCHGSRPKVGLGPLARNLC